MSRIKSVRFIIPLLLLSVVMLFISCNKTPEAKSIQNSSTPDGAKTLQTDSLQIDRVQPVPPTVPTTINGKRPFIFILQNTNMYQVSVHVKIFGPARASGPSFDTTLIIPSPSSPSPSYDFGIAINKDLGVPIPGVDYYSVELTPTYYLNAICSDSAVWIP